MHNLETQQTYVNHAVYTMYIPQSPPNENPPKARNTPKKKKKKKQKKTKKNKKKT